MKFLLGVTGIFIHRIGKELHVLVDYGEGPGMLGDDGNIRYAGELWVMRYYRPRHMSRYRREVKPLPQPILERKR